MISILTPTYNRAYILSNAFKSLCVQTSFDFEWIIIDDGSSDNTSEIVEKWKSEDLPFLIRYEKQKNGGKHRAVNKGVQIATFEYILILDSDDYLVDNAVALIHEWIDTIKDQERFAGVSGLKGDIKTNEVIGGAIKQDFVDATNIERIKFNLVGDKAEVYRKDILEQYPFPEFDNEHFLRESASWDRIAKAGYIIRWFNKIIYLCEYLDDGLTKKTDISRYKDNFKGFTYCAKLYVEAYPFPYNYLKIGSYSDMAKQFGKSEKEICDSLNINFTQLLLGKIIYMLNKTRKKSQKMR